MNFQSFPPSLLILSPRLTRTGDPSASVQGINTTTVADGAYCYCEQGPSTFRLDKADSATPPNGTTVIKPAAGPGRWKEFGAGGSGALVQIGFDGVQEYIGQYAANFWRDVLRATATRLAVPLPSFTAGNVLLVMWSITAQDGDGEPSQGIQISGAPTVEVGAGEQSIYLGGGGIVVSTSPGPGGTLTTTSTTGFAAIALGSVTDPVTVRLRMIVSGDTALIQPGSGWLLAAELRAGAVPFVPPSTLGPLPP
jgi:hypothetical protein